MRSAADIRDRLVRHFRFILKRPGGTGTADSAELELLHHLELIAFIDEREADLDALKAVFVTGCRRVTGQFEFENRRFPRFTNEVGSVYAEVAFRMGYLVPDRLLTPGEMARLVRTVRDPAFTDTDLTESEMIARFGKPSHEVVGGSTTVACYGCETPETKWVFFDLARQAPGSGPYDWLPAPVVRDFRTSVRNHMTLMPFGRRWVDG